MSLPPCLLDQLRQELRVKHYSYRTEQAYSLWIRKFIFFQGDWADPRLCPRSCSLAPDQPNPAV